MIEDVDIKTQLKINPFEHKKISSKKIFMPNGL